MSNIEELYEKIEKNNKLIQGMLRQINQILGFEKIGETNLSYCLDTEFDQENRKKHLAYCHVENQINMLIRILKSKENMLLDFYTKNASTQGYVYKPPNWIVENHFPNKKNDD